MQNLILNTSKWHFLIKFGQFLQKLYTYSPPTPKPWNSLKSDEIIERDLVTDSRPKVNTLYSTGCKERNGPPQNLIYLFLCDTYKNFILII